VPVPRQAVLLAAHGQASELLETSVVLGGTDWGAALLAAGGVGGAPGAPLAAEVRTPPGWARAAVG
jgi:hypothetical protein